MSDKESGIRLNRLTIKNYKKIDYLEIDFPLPVMKGDADILVLGSKNGGGKTSVLECCALSVLTAMIGGKIRYAMDEILFDISSLVKAGELQANIDAIFSYNNKKFTTSLGIDDKYGFSGCTIIDSPWENDILDNISYCINNILSFSNEPLISPPLLHFNSYRKIRESKPELGMMSEDYSLHYPTQFGKQDIRNPVSFFKLEIIHSLMAKNDLFEGINKAQSEADLEQLNLLIKRYCNGQIERLRPLPDNKVDIRIKPINGKESFSFDGLSSGQKEMIATLFLIWKNTKEQPSIVLIDEPELHLNAEWHGDFIRQLHKLAPNNQYIIATHSEEIFNSVDENYRAVLIPNEE